MNIHLRGHHLLCLLGFRGMGYSNLFADNMKQVYERLRKEPETVVQIVNGVDDLCKCFPGDQPYHCDNTSVHERDQAVIRHLNIVEGDQLEWNEILQRIRTNITPQHVPVWCNGCPWLTYGVCEEGVGRVVNGEGLSALSVAKD